ncbi:MAG: hypothetical protein FJ087_23675 [Deltaproteobacteria bacterium]|nr:hypothetical protein [Deltaproteobacteria bacterium]
MRYSPGLRGGQGQGRPDRTDHQIDVGLHASQGLWDTGGLQADWSYRHLFAASGVLPRKLTQAQFAFLTTDFIAGGHRAYVRLKQVFPLGFSVTAGVEYRTLVYRGWPAVDAVGNALSFDREDKKLMPGATLRYAHSFGSFGLTAEASYTFVRQWSNSADYDTDGHLVAIGLSAEY